jgi:TonB-dependent receptor
MVKRNLLFACLVLIALLPLQLRAQSGNATISGTITDAQTGEALIGASISVDSTSWGSAADFDGNFVMPNMPAGEYSLTVSYIGYEDVSKLVSVVAGKNTEVDFELGFSGVTLGAIEVTAQALGQMNAINEQLNADDIRNVVSAQRIQELPDANAAETVGRISGVSVLRSGGEGNKVVIRGMSPKYNKITIEGVSMSGGESDRSADISMISPYSLDGIEVRKTATADNEADFIGGSVNFKLRSASEGWNYDFVAQGGYNNLKKTFSDYMLIGSVGNRFIDNKLGIYLQGNVERRNRSSNSLLASYNVRNNAIVGEENPVFIQSLSLSNAFRERSRAGFTAVLDFKIPDGIFHFMNIYNNGVSKIDRYNQIFSVSSRRHAYEAKTEEYKLNTYTNILDFEKRLGSFKIDAKVSHSFTKNSSPKNLSFLFEQEGALTSDVANEAISPIEVLDFAEIDDTKTFFNKITESYINTEERQISASANLAWSFNISDQVNGVLKTGGLYRYQNRSHDREVFGSDLKIGSGQSGNDAIIMAYPWMEQTVSLGDRLPYTLFNVTNFDHGDFLEGEYDLGPAANLPFMQEVLGVIKNAEGLSMDAYSKLDRSSTTFNYSGKEDIYAGYLLAEFNLGDKIKFNPGVRYEKNKTEYTGVRGVTNIAFAERNYAGHDTTFVRENSFFLPMINMKYTPVKWMDIRLAYTQTLSRPSYSLFNPRSDIWGNTVSYNNYKLKPEEATNYDVYISFHQNHIGLFTVGGFYKEIKNQVFDLGKRVITNPEDFDLPPELKFRDIYTFANNTHTAKVKGIELDWQTNFWYLPGALKGLVLNVNYTHIISEAKYPFTTVENIADGPFDPPEWVNNDSFYVSKLINQPDDIVNIQLGFDYKGFSTRVSMLYQSEIFQRANFWPELSQFTDSYLRWDVSVKQKLPWFGMQVFCNLNNITGAKDVNLIGGQRWDASIDHYGMTIDVGLRVKFNGDSD